MNTAFYTYIHAKPDGSVFYVGKGKGRRAYKLSGRSDHHQKVINKYGQDNILVGKIECSSEEIAFDLEKGLIKCFRRMGTSLTNKTDGGDGVSGLRHTDGTKQQLREMFDDPEHREKHSVALKEAHIRSKDKYRKSARESQNRPDIKAKHCQYQGSPEVVAAKSEWGKKAWSDPQVRLRRVSAMVSASARPEVKEKRSKGLLGKNKDKISMMRGDAHRMIRKDQFDEFVSNGWVRGNPSSKGRQITKGRVWVNNGVINRMVYPHEARELLSNGWSKNRVKK